MALVGVAVAELVEGCLFPGVGLASVLGELDGGESGGHSAEESAGVDLGQLSRVTDEHDLDLLLLGVVEESGQLAGADHPGLVHHEHRPGLQRRPDTVLFELSGQSSERGRRDAGRLLEFECGAGGERDAGDADA